MTGTVDAGTLDWNKGEGLLPAVVQHAHDGRVLMLGYMNREALELTQARGRVTFYSRSRQTLWTKGDTSGHVLHCKAVYADCDRDALVVLAEPQGPVCHQGTATCFADEASPAISFLGELDALIEKRDLQRPPGSYTTELFASGINRIAQKVGEEGVETALAAATESNESFLGEAADLTYHLLVLLRARSLGLDDLSACLRERHGK